MKAVILAGGGGTRLWPVSRANVPKQIQTFMGGGTLLQMTYQRLRRAFAPSDIYISSNRRYLPFLRKQLPSVSLKQFILEPEKRDTAAAIGLAAVTIAKRFPKESMFMANSDHYIKDVREYIRFVRLTGKAVHRKPDHSVLIGLKPTYPETGLGYIKINKLAFQLGDTEVFYGEKFVEKPNLETAKRFFQRWDYLWNTAMFCWRVDHLLGLYKKYLPAHFRILKKIQHSIGSASEQQTTSREFVKLKPISIDYGIMEKVKKMLVLPADFDWVDVGHWRTVHEVLARRKKESVVGRGKHVGLDSHGNYLYSATGKLVATIGVKNMVIIETEDALLVCPKERAQDVKKLVELLEKKGLKRYL